MTCKYTFKIISKNAIQTCRNISRIFINNPLDKSKALLICIKSQRRKDRSISSMPSGDLKHWHLQFFMEPFDHGILYFLLLKRSKHWLIYWQQLPAFPPQLSFHWVSTWLVHLWLNQLGDRLQQKIHSKITPLAMYKHPLGAPLSVSKRAGGLRVVAKFLGVQNFKWIFKKHQVIINHKISSDKEEFNTFSESIIGMWRHDRRTFLACQDFLGRHLRHNSSFAPGWGCWQPTLCPFSLTPDGQPAYLHSLLAIQDHQH